MKPKSLERQINEDITDLKYILENYDLREDADMRQHARFLAIHIVELVCKFSPR